MNVTIKGLALAALLTFGLAAQQPPPATPSIHAKAASRLVIRNAMVIYGNAKPPYGPVDIVVQDGLISYVGPPESVVGGSAVGPTSQRSSALGRWACALCRPRALRKGAGIWWNINQTVDDNRPRCSTAI